MPGLSAVSWPLLFWCGLAAAIASEWVAGLGSVLSRPRERTAIPRLMTRPRGSTLVHVLTGAILFAPVYGILFELAGRADLGTGAALGAAHGLLGTAWTLWASKRGDARLRPATRSMLYHRAGRTVLRVVYGAVLGFLYVVPGG